MFLIWLAKTAITIFWILDICNMPFMEIFDTTFNCAWHSMSRYLNWKKFAKKNAQYDIILKNLFYSNLQKGVIKIKKQKKKIANDIVIPFARKLYHILSKKVNFLVFSKERILLVQ